jgi:hypothetical protein
MNANDRSLIVQIMKAGRYSAVFDFMPQYNLEKSKEVIEQMGDKWCCHPSNQVKKLDVPLDILKTHQSKVFKRKA